MGRGTSEDEAKAYLASLGLDPHAVLDGLKERRQIEVPTDEMMIAEFKEAIYVQMKLGELKSTPLVNALKALSILADAAKANEPADDTPERDIADVLADAGLPAGRRVEIGQQELEKLYARAEALKLLVEKIGAET